MSIKSTACSSVTFQRPQHSILMSCSAWKLYCEDYFGTQSHWNYKDQPPLGLPSKDWSIQASKECAYTDHIWLQHLLNGKFQDLSHIIMILWEEFQSDDHFDPKLRTKIVINNDDSIQQRSTCQVRKRHEFWWTCELPLLRPSWNFKMKCKSLSHLQRIVSNRCNHWLQEKGYFFLCLQIYQEYIKKVGQTAKVNWFCQITHASSLSKQHLRSDLKCYVPRYSLQGRNWGMRISIHWSLQCCTINSNSLHYLLVSYILTHLFPFHMHHRR